jgi:hypothetical protein
MPIARADIKFGLYTDFLDRTLSAEDERLPGESIEDGVIRVHDALERAAAILKKRVQESNPEPSLTRFPPPLTEPAVMEIQTERGPENQIAELIADIYLCQDVGALESFRLLAKQSPESQSAYNQKHTELSSKNKITLP